MPRKKILIGAAGLLIAVAVVYANVRYRRGRGPEVSVEAIVRRDLEAIVSASGKIQPKESVNISANTIGRITRLAVEEGDRVRAGQFLLQIDPKTLESAVQRGEAGLQAAREAVKQARAAVESARASLELARHNRERQRELWKEQLTPREAVEKAESELRVREADRQARDTEVRLLEQRLRQDIASLQSARHDLSYVTIQAPMDGIVTRLNIKEGETVLVGTMNNPGTVLMTIADLSVIEARVEVDETDIVEVAAGHKAKVTIDAFPDREFRGTVTKIGSSAIQPATPQDVAARQATNFEVVVTLEDQVPEARPGFTCTAEITTGTRSQAVAVPIQALTVREMTLDASGQIVREERKDRRRSKASANPGPEELKPGETRKETEGVFLFREGKAVFTPVKIGIAGEKYFEVLSGLGERDRVVTGPYNSVRELEDGDPVRIEQPKKARR